MNPYEVLGVSETATDEQVRSAYIKLVKKYHPDRYQDSDLKDLANDKLKQVNEAYDTITNMRKNGSASQNTYSGSGFGGYSGAAQCGMALSLWYCLFPRRRLLLRPQLS